MNPGGLVACSRAASASLAGGLVDGAATPGAEGRGLSSRLREGRDVDDAEFDATYPCAARKVSSTFWTPVSVARRAAELLADGPSTRVLDVGSGVGKFCIVGAASTSATFVGVEHRGHLVDRARAAARRLGVPSAHFVHGTLDAMEAADFDAFYFYNPFEENLCSPDEHLDDTVPLSLGRYVADVKHAQRMLAAARPGARVVTYHGLGGIMPEGYVLSHREPLGSSCLRLWVKAASVARLPAPSAPSTIARSLVG